MILWFLCIYLIHVHFAFCLSAHPCFWPVNSKHPWVLTRDTTVVARGQSSEHTHVLYTADKLLARLLTVNDYREVYDQLHHLRARWWQIGVHLRLHVDDLENIEKDCRNNEQRLQKMLLLWLRRRSRSPTWQKLISALRHETVGDEGAAEDLKTYVMSKGRPFALSISLCSCA